MTYKDKLDQLNLIFGVIGTPEPEDLEHVQGDVRQYLASLRPVPPKNFRSMFPGAPPEALDLLRSMLRFNPKKRITVNEVCRRGGRLMPHLAGSSSSGNLRH